MDFDKTYSKEQILEWYLNYIYLGEGCYGVATAAQNYFGKELSELDLAECASLISITNNPSAYNPYQMCIRDSSSSSAECVSRRVMASTLFWSTREALRRLAGE